MSTSKRIMGSFSEPNVNLIYVCLVGNITPANMSAGCEAGQSALSCHVIDNINEEVGTSKDDDTAIEVQRSAAYHELIESCRKLECSETIEEVDSKIFLPLLTDDNSEQEQNGNPKILRLTGTKWLSESRDGSPDAREALRPSSSESSVSEDLVEHYSTHKALSTVLALDKEHNLFGLSNTYIQAPRMGKKMHKENDSKAVFHQTAIVSSCYKTCCRRRSKSDLPPSLKCGGCKSKCSCARCRSCTSCTSLCSVSCGPCGSCAGPSPPCGAPCVVPCPFYWRKPCPPKPCPPCPGCCSSACTKDCTRFGLQVSVKKKPKFEPVYSEIQPRSSCVLLKPLAARSCHHTPCCIPPSSCFPYLMPCFWPARYGAPCSEPARCFHNPPCPRGRVFRGRVAPEGLCPVGHPCAGKEKNEKCENYSCIGRNNEALARALSEYNKRAPPPQQHEEDDYDHHGHHDHHKKRT